MGKFIVGTSADATYQKLHAAGLFPCKPDTVRRVVIDLKVGELARIYYEVFGEADSPSEFGDLLVAGLTNLDEVE